MPVRIRAFDERNPPEPRDSRREASRPAQSCQMAPVFASERCFFGQTRIGGAPHDEALRFELTGKGPT